MPTTVKVSVRGKDFTFYPSSWGDLYVVGSVETPGRLKVGRTHSPGKMSIRLKSLQTGSPVALEVVALYPEIGFIEKAVHAYLAPMQLRLEWFTCSLSDIEGAIESLGYLTPEASVA